MLNPLIVRGIPYGMRILESVYLASEVGRFLQKKIRGKKSGKKRGQKRGKKK